jgi:hypothetical protein
LEANMTGRTIKCTHLIRQYGRGMEFPETKI